jgi:hypothetical protein
MPCDKEKLARLLCSTLQQQSFRNKRKDCLGTQHAVHVISVLFDVWTSEGFLVSVFTFRCCEGDIFLQIRGLHSEDSAWI